MPDGTSPQVIYQGPDFWKNYMVHFFGEDLIDKWYQHAQEAWIQSQGQDLHLEIYDTGDKDRDTIIFSHGIAGYGRVLLPFTIRLWERGYNVLAPDLQGYGYNPGIKGDFQWKNHVRNLMDTVEYARTRFSGNILLGGASMGGPLAYEAACLSEDIHGLICWCLFEFTDRDLIRNQSTLGAMTYGILPLLTLSARLCGRLRMKTYWFISYDTLSIQDQVDLIKVDPQAGTRISLRAAVSLITQSDLKVPYEDFTIPTIVFQPGADRMTPPEYTERVYRRLGSPKKRYLELEGAEHFPVEAHYYDQFANACDEFLKSIS